MNPFELVVVLGLGLIAFVIYFLPGIIASMRGHRNSLAIWALNLCLGWTAIGWVVALVWSLLAQDRDVRA